MSAISVGRIVTKIMGREAGRRAVVTDIIDRNFVEITGPVELTGVKRRRVNINHVEPSEHEIDISRDDNSDEKIMKFVDGDDDIKNFLTTIIS
jgi:large subunit ribosomal protein L14e